MDFAKLFCSLMGQIIKVWLNTLNHLSKKACCTQQIAEDRSEKYEKQKPQNITLRCNMWFDKRDVVCDVEEKTLSVAYFYQLFLVISILLFRSHLWVEELYTQICSDNFGLADRYIQRREMRVVSLKSSSTVEFEIKKIFSFNFVFSRSYWGLKFFVHTW